MFDRVNVHIVITLIWIIMYVFVWWIFQYYLLDLNDLKAELLNIENMIQGEDWTDANISYQRLESLWNKKRIGLQFNNGTTVVESFERELAQLGTMISYEQKNAIQYLGGLKEDIKTISTAFPGP